jgi:hypothetical protein
MQDPRSEQLNLAGTHLNLTAILTKLGKHKEAVTHAKASIVILRRLIDKKEAIHHKQSLHASDVPVSGDQPVDPETQALQIELSL